MHMVAKNNSIGVNFALGWGEARVSFHIKTACTHAVRFVRDVR